MYGTKIKVVDGGTFFQVDIHDNQEDSNITVFIKTSDIFKELNNFLYITEELKREKQGFFKLTNEPNDNIIN